MKSTAELFVESLTEWPEPLSSAVLTPGDRYEVASILTGTRIDNVDDNVGLSIATVIESQSLTIKNFEGNEGLFAYAFAAVMETEDAEYIKRFHKMHGKSYVDWINNNRDHKEQSLFFKNIFTPKEA